MCTHPTWLSNFHVFLNLNLIASLYTLKKPGNQTSTRQASLKKGYSREACYSALTTLSRGNFLLGSFSSAAGPNPAWDGLKDTSTANVASARRKCWKLSKSVSMPGLLLANTCVKHKQTALRLPLASRQTLAKHFTSQNKSAGINCVFVWSLPSGVPGNALRLLL